MIKINNQNQKKRILPYEAEKQREELEGETKKEKRKKNRW